MIRAFRAVDDRSGCARFVLEHIQVLQHIGVITVVRPDISWCTDPNVYVVVAEHSKLGMIAGIRLHKSSEGNTLPMQHCVHGFDHGSRTCLPKCSRKATLRLRAYGMQHDIRAGGIPFLLMETVVSLANQIGAGSLVTFIADYVAPYAMRSGFVPMDELKDAGRFPFPIPGYVTQSMVMRDPLTLANADQETRRNILSLRMRPVQTRTETPKKTVLSVYYDLLLDQGHMPLYNDLYRMRSVLAA